jgi:hypothetical protein
MVFAVNFLSGRTLCSPSFSILNSFRNDVLKTNVYPDPEPAEGSQGRRIDPEKTLRQAQGPDFGGFKEWFSTKQKK